MAEYTHNQGYSEQVAKSEKMQNYLKWLKDSGALFPKVDYPAIFVFDDTKETLTGAVCKEEIKPREAICYVPNKLFLSTEKARNSEIAEILSAHEDVFVAYQERDFMVLCLYLIFERSKGEESFWHPYFEIVELVDLPSQWDDEVIDKLVDAELKANVRIFKEQSNKEWQTLKGIIEMNGQWFPDGCSDDRALFDWACAMVAQR